MKIGYTRVSTRDQNADLQVDALKQAGCERIYQDIASGAKSARPELDKLLGHVRPGDTVVIWKLDRLGRSLKHLVELVGELARRKVGLQSLNDPIDTTHAQGRLVFNLFASLAEFERELIRERTQAGLSAARARGRVGGRPKGLPATAEATAMAAETLYREGRLSVSAIGEKLHISKSTLYSYLRHRGVAIGTYQKSARKRDQRPPSRAAGRADYRTGGHHHAAPGGDEQQQVRARPETGHGEHRALLPRALHHEAAGDRPLRADHSVSE